MTNILDKMNAIKKQEVDKRYAMIKNRTDHPLQKILLGEANTCVQPSFLSALSKNNLSVIAEIKRKSPSKGELASIEDPLALAEQYIAAHADAISVLTDQTYFNGNISDLKTIKENISNQHIPFLRKDFIIDNIQIAEAYLNGASAVLIIIALSKEKSHELIQFAESLGLDALVEVHDENEIPMAIDANAKIIGINNRNLKTLDLDTNTAFNLIHQLPKNIIKVAESGIADPLLAKKYRAAGFDAVLIGEALVKADHPSSFIKACKNESPIH